MSRMHLGIIFIVEACWANSMFNVMANSMANSMVGHKLKTLISSCLRGGCYGLGFMKDAFLDQNTALSLEATTRFLFEL